MKYVVNVVETLRRRVIVEATDPEEAIRKVEWAYEDGRVNLDYKRLKGYEIKSAGLAYGGDLERYEEVEV